MRLNFQRRVLYTVGVSLASIVLLLLAWQIRDVMLIGFAGFIVAVFFDACAGGVRRVTRLPHGWSLFVTIAVLTGAVVLGGLLFLPSVIAQLNELFVRLPTLLGDLRAALERTSWGNTLLTSLPDTAALSGEAGSVFAGVGSTVSITVSSIADAVFIVVIGVFLAATPGAYQRGLLRLVPSEFEGRVKTLLGEVIATLQAWLIGQSIAMFFVAVFTTVGLTLAGVPFPLALGIIAGLLDLIPFFGPLMAAIPAVLIGFTNGVWTGVWAAVAFLVVQQLEGNVIQPLVQRRAVQIPPAILVLALIVMGKLFGFLGVLVATPLAAVILLLVRHLYVRGVLNKQADGV